MSGYPQRSLHVIWTLKKKKYSTNELELLAVVWSVDRFKHYLLGKEFVIAIDHEALTSTFGENRSNKIYQSRVTRWVDRLLPYQFKVVHIPGRDYGNSRVFVKRTKWGTVA